MTGSEIKKAISIIKGEAELFLVNQQLEEMNMEPLEMLLVGKVLKTKSTESVLFLVKLYESLKLTAEALGKAARVMIS